MCWAKNLLTSRAEWTKKLLCFLLSKAKNSPVTLDTKLIEKFIGDSLDAKFNELEGKLMKLIDEKRFDTSEEEDCVAKFTHENNINLIADALGEVAGCITAIDRQLRSDTACVRCPHQATDST